MLISTVCKTARVIANSWANSVSPFSISPPYARVTHGFYDIVIDTPCRFERRLSTRASGGIRIDRLDRFFDFQPASRNETELSRPTLRSRSAGRSFESDIVSHPIFCVASGRAPVSLTMACVLNWSPCRGGTRRYTVYKYH